MGVDIYKRHHLLNLSGGPLSVYETGGEDLPPVLLLHGAMSDEARLIWHNLAPFLSETRHVYALDFPRHGQSRPWKGFAGQENLIQVVNEVISSFKLPPLPLIGLSMGGGVAIGYMLKYPERVTGAVLMAPGGLGEKVKMQFTSWLFIKTPGAVKYLSKYYAKMKPDKMKKTMISLLNDGEKSRDFEDLLAVLTDEAKKKWQYGENSMDDWQLEGMAPFRLKINLLPELKNIKCPVLYLRGENDPLVRQAEMDEAQRLTPGAKIILVKNAGHLLPLEQPDEVNRAVADFLKENDI